MTAGTNDFTPVELSLGPSVGLVAQGTEDRVLSPGFTEEPCSQRAERGDLWKSARSCFCG